MSLKAVLFDVDGTLADTEALGHLPAYNAAFDDLALDWQWSESLYRDDLLLLPGGRERLRHYVDVHQPTLGSDQAAAFRDDPDDWVNAVHAQKSKRFRERLTQGLVPLRLGVERLMAECHANGLQLAIVSNASRRSLEPFLEFTLGDLCSLVPDVISGEQVERKKPFPDLYLRAADQLGVDTSECIAIEDSSMGLEAAVAAGVATVVTVNSNTKFQQFPGAALVVSSLGDASSACQVLQGDYDCNVIDLELLRRIVDDRATPRSSA